MMIQKKKVACLLLASLFLAVAGLAQPDGALSAMIPGEPVKAGEPLIPLHDPPEGVPIEVLYSGRGFALLDNESLVLRLNIETVLPLQPSQVQRLLASNKSLEEIRDEIQSRKGEAVRRGGIRLNKSIYHLADIALSPSGDNSTDLNAQVSAGSCNDTENGIIGSMALNIVPTDDGMMGKGELVLYSGPDAGKYSVLLDLQEHRHGMHIMGPRGEAGPKPN